MLVDDVAGDLCLSLLSSSERRTRVQTQSVWMTWPAISARPYDVVIPCNRMEQAMRELSGEELKEKTVEFKARLKAGETLDDLMVEAFAVVRETGQGGC